MQRETEKCMHRERREKKQRQADTGETKKEERGGSHKVYIIYIIYNIYIEEPLGKEKAQSWAGELRVEGSR